jgi:hypothetical protein
VAAVPIAKTRLGLPVIVDPSHAAGNREWVESLTLAGVACGGDGLLIETHPEPGKALSDGPQAVALSDFPALMEKARRVAHAMGRSIPMHHPRGARVDLASRGAPVGSGAEARLVAPSEPLVLL